MATISYTIPNNFYPDVKEDFLAAQPVPKNEQGDPIMSDADWIKEWGRLQFVKARRRGQIIKAQNNISSSNDWIS